MTPTTLECLAIARHMFDLTGGAFDVSIGTGLPSLELDPDESLVLATTAGVRLDLGGIGKGYAVDLMAEVLEEWGLSAALVHGGFSSVLALDAPPGHDGWPLTLSDPGVPSRELARLSIRQTALGASGVRKGDHILDPRTGTPVRTRLGAWASVPRPRDSVPETVAAPQPRAAAGAVTDALATAFMLLSDEGIEQLCERSPGLEAWIVEDAPPPVSGAADSMASLRQRRTHSKRTKDMAGPDDSNNTKAQPAPHEPRVLGRREVLKGLSTVPALGLFGYAWQRQRQYQQSRAEEAVAAANAPAAGLQEINVALLGAGAQGQVLTDAMLRIPGLRFRAVCDVWTEYNQRRVVNSLKRFKHEVNGYEDYREMLDKEKALDAVIIATPDFWHAQHAIDCLEAGKHVYCEKEMSNTLEGARSMVAAARKSGNLLQIGHQRRSNPRYLHCYEKLLQEAKLLGRIVTVHGQWNRAVTPDLGAPDRYVIPAARLKQYGFKDMHQFRNWRWYKGKGGGPIVDLGSHQIDIYSWFLGANPSHVMASGGNLYYDRATHEWYDTVMAVYDYDTPLGPAKAYYQTQTTNGSQGYFENFMGDQGTLLISESEVNYAGLLYRDPNAPAWDEWVQKGYVNAPKEQEAKAKSDSGAIADVRESVAPDQHTVPVTLRDPYHQPHLQNFFDAVRGKAKLNCPAEVAYETAVAVLKVNEAIEAKSRVSFRPEEFTV